MKSAFCFSPSPHRRGYRTALRGVSPNPRKFFHDKSSPAAIAFRSMISRRCETPRCRDTGMALRAGEWETRSATCRTLLYPGSHRCRKRVCLTYRVKIIQWLFIRKWRDNVVPNGRRIACSFVLEEINLLYHSRHGACNERWGK